MKIVKIYSHLNGLEYLKVHLPELWEEVQEIIASVDAEACKTKKSKEKTKMDKLLYSPVEMNKKFKCLLNNKNWKDSKLQYYVTADDKLARKTLGCEPKKQKEMIVESGEEPFKAFNRADYIKNRVGLTVQFGKYFSVTYDLFVKHMAFYVSDKIDLAIEILPMKVLAQEMSSGVPNYEGELYNVIRQGRSTPAVPLVIIGISQ